VVRRRSVVGADGHIADYSCNQAAVKLRPNIIILGRRTGASDDGNGERPVRVGLQV